MGPTGLPISASASTSLQWTTEVSTHDLMSSSIECMAWLLPPWLSELAGPLLYVPHQAVCNPDLCTHVGERPSPLRSNLHGDNSRL